MSKCKDCKLGGACIACCLCIRCVDKKPYGSCANCAEKLMSWVRTWRDIWHGIATAQMQLIEKIKDEYTDELPAAELSEINRRMKDVESIRCNREAR